MLLKVLHVHLASLPLPLRTSTISNTVFVVYIGVKTPWTKAEKKKNLGQKQLEVANHCASGFCHSSTLILMSARTPVKHWPENSWRREESFLETPPRAVCLKDMRCVYVAWEG